MKKNIDIKLKNENKFRIIVSLNNNKENSDMLSYVLAIPINNEKENQLIVESLNFEGTDDEKVILKEHIKDDLVKKLELVDEKHSILIPFLPDVKGGIPYYQQLSKECFIKDDKYYRVDLKVVNVINEAKNILSNDMKKEVSDKIILNGYSSSGVFAQRFALIHPQLVDKVVVGGAIGSIPIPSDDLPYPLGIQDFNQLFEKDFANDEYSNIAFAYYVGEFEAKDISKSRENMPMHDMSYMERSVPKSIGEKQREIFGKTLQERWKNCIQYYKKHNYNITEKIYKGVGHKDIYNNKSVIKDIQKFIESGEKFKEDADSAYNIYDFDVDKVIEK